MHDVSNAINILDPNKDAIDKAICGNGKWETSSASNEAVGKCASGGTSMSGANFDRLSHMFEGGTASTNRKYPTDATSKMGNHTSETISKDVTALNREQHGVVSSAFAKAHEGARSSYKEKLRLGHTRSKDKF